MQCDMQLQPSQFLLSSYSLFSLFDSNEHYYIVSKKTPYVTTYLFSSLVIVKGTCEIATLMNNWGMSRIPQYSLVHHKSHFAWTWKGILVFSHPYKKEYAIYIHDKTLQIIQTCYSF